MTQPEARRLCGTPAIDHVPLRYVLRARITHRWCSPARSGAAMTKALGIAAVAVLAVAIEVAVFWEAVTHFDGCSTGF